MWQKFEHYPKDLEHILVDYGNEKDKIPKVALKIWKYDFYINDAKGMPDAKWYSVENIINSRKL